MRWSLLEVVCACASEGWRRWFGGGGGSGGVPSSPKGEGAPPPQLPAKPRPYLGMSVTSLSPDTRDALQRHLPLMPNANAGSCVFQVRSLPILYVYCIINLHMYKILITHNYCTIAFVEMGRLYGRILSLLQ